MSEVTVAMIKKVRTGEPLDDVELGSLLAWYRDLQNKLTMLGPTYALARYDVTRTLDTLEGFERSRRR